MESKCADLSRLGIPTAGKNFEKPSPTQPTLVILAHADPEHVRRLINVCQYHTIILHCDKKTPDAVFDRMTSGLPNRVILAPRHDARLFSWSLVKAELACIRLALDFTDANHIVVMSGADYPLIDPARLAEVLAPFPGVSWMWNVNLPYPPWSVRGFRDGGLWRFRYHFAARNDQILWLGNKPAFSPFKRKIHPDLQPRASTQWKVLSRPDALKLVQLLDSRPDLISFGRSTFGPDESFIPSIMGSPRLWGQNTLATCDDSSGPWLTNWTGHVFAHPESFTPADLPRIQDKLRNLIMMPSASAHNIPNGGIPLFARKFNSCSGPDFYDRLQEALW